MPCRGLRRRGSRAWAEVRVAPIVRFPHGPAEDGNPVPAPDDPLLLFSGDFESLENLTPLKGKWEIEDGDLVTKKKGEHRILFGDPSWTDMEIQGNSDPGEGEGIWHLLSNQRGKEIERLPLSI